IVTLRGTNYNGDGGGNWMGIDYVKLNKVPTNPLATKLHITCALHYNALTCNAPTPCSAGEANTSFVQENGSINPLPGSPVSTSVARGADNDYYFAGVYTNVIASVTASYEIGRASCRERV